MPTYTVLPASLTCYSGYKPPSLKNVVAYVQCWPQDIAAELCRRVDAGHIYQSAVHDPSKGQVVQHYHRSSEGVTVDRTTYDYVCAHTQAVATHHLAQRLIGPPRQFKLAEALQFLRYTATAQGRFRRHWDDAYYDADGMFQFVAPQRKFVAITLLNDDYEGGELVLDTVRDEEGKQLELKLAAGAMLIFPSDQRFPHEVRPVTKGIRRSVVAWFDFDVPA